MVEMENHETPEFTLKGNNQLRYLAIALILIVLFAGFFAMPTVGVVILLPVLALFGMGIYTIRFPSVSVYRHSLIIRHSALLKQFSNEERIAFDSIEQVDHIEGYTDRSQMIVQTFLGTAAYGGFSEPERIVLLLNGNKKKVILRFGKKSEFEKLSEVLRKKASRR
jgi:hypothetical protein